MASAGIVGLLAGLGAVGTATPAQSQTSAYIMLEGRNGNAKIWGELLDFDGQTYMVRSSVGTMKVNADAVRCIGDACPAIRKRVAQSSTAGQVVLKAAKDGSEIRGKLVGFDGKVYIIRTVLGDFRISKSIAECHGAACPAADARAPQFAVYSAGDAMQQLMSELWRGFAEAHGHRLVAAEDDGSPETLQLFDAEETLIAEVSLRKGDVDGAVGALSDGEAEIAVLDRDLDAGLAEAAGLDIGRSQQALLGYDGLVVVANHDLPVRDIAPDEMRRIWAGQLDTWRSLGGGDFPITMHVVESRVAEAPRSLVQFARFGGAQPKTVVYHATEAEVIAAVQADRNAIGLVNRVAAVKAHAKMLGIRKVCGLTAPPTEFELQTDHYPMTMPIRAYGKGAGLHPVAAEFVEWARSDEVAPVVADAGFTSAGLKRMKIRDMGMALIHTAAVESDFDGREFASMMRELRYADRLSITFRFLPGSSTLDRQSVESVRDLADRLRARDFDGQELLLVGFADNVGPARQNTVLAAQRAEAVREVLAAEFDEATLSQVRLRTLSFGEQMPIDCNDTDAGRANNRRVEVWTRVAGGV